MAKNILINVLAAAAVIIGILLGFQLDALWPFSLPVFPSVVTWVLLGAGLALIILAEIDFLSRARAFGALGVPTPKLVISGVYRWVRNPIYLGGILVLLGLALDRRSPTLLTALFLYLPIIHWYVLRREEPRLERDFGNAYQDYRSRVPRWLPRPPKNQEPSPTNLPLR